MREEEEQGTVYAKALRQANSLLFQEQREGERGEAGGDWIIEGLAGGRWGFKLWRDLIFTF